jgi:hypothetical protein
MISVLESEVAANQAASEVPTDSIEAYNGSSHLEIRKRGCFILDAALVSPTSGELIRVLYADPDTTKPKLSASHPMIPVGPYNGPGGQHGPYRWLDYGSSKDSSDPEVGIRVRLFPKISDKSQFSKLFLLAESKLTTMTSIRNLTEEPIDTSIGAHDYYRLEDQDVAGLLLDGKPLTQALDRPDAIDALMNEETLFINKFKRAEIHFPAGYDVRITANGQSSMYVPKGVGMMIWKRKDTDSICFEPTFGRVSDEENTGLRIMPSMEASLFTTIELL